jgi:hypothetical protein
VTFQVLRTRTSPPVAGLNLESATRACEPSLAGEFVPFLTIPVYELIV